MNRLLSYFFGKMNIYFFIAPKPEKGMNFHFLFLALLFPKFSRFLPSQQKYSYDAGGNRPNYGGC